jgi:ribosomal-protein-serine acetyltransferase
VDFLWPIGDGLNLRLLEPRHAGLMFALIDRNRERLRPWFRWAPDVRAVEDVRERIEQNLKRMADDGRRYTLIEAGGEPAGLVYICEVDPRHDRIELGYWLDGRFEGRGIMTRACSAMVAFGFGVLGVNRIDITADVDNARSRAVAERLGFTLEAILAEWTTRPDGQRRDMASYRLLRRDWSGGDG